MLYLAIYKQKRFFNWRIMKFLAFFVLFVVVASKHNQFDPELNEQWENFKKTFGKVYNDSEEINRRSIWEQRVADIIRHNLNYDLGLSSYRMGINKFSDMEHQEFVRLFSGYRHQPGQKTNASAWVPVVNAEIPDQVDWRTEGLVTPVGYQGQCGACWAFAANGALEGQQKKKTGKLVPLSVQNLVDCSKRQGNRGCRGGFPTGAYEYIKRNKGIDTEASYPYTAEEGSCRFKRSSVAATITGYVQIKQGDEEALKQAVATIGPIAAAFNSKQESFRNYRGGIYDDSNCSPIPNHGGVIVGYGTEDGKDYWLVKNSWGTSWGINGYAKMSRNKRNQCGIATAANYPLV